MRVLAETIRRLDEILGDGEKSVAPCESDSVQVMRTGIAAARDLPEGHRLEFEDLTWLRPRSGFVPGQEELLIGNRTTRTVTKGEPFSEEMIERI